MSHEARYRLVRNIAAGGMAQVVEAVATGAAGFERRVAIKWVLPEMAHDDSMRRMFLDEARIASQLHHGNIVQVLDYGLMDGSEFMVCEYVDGTDMNRARKLSGGTVPEAVALYVVSQVAHALEHAHGRADSAGRPLGIVHRDVSPANVLVSWDGDTKLSDFGIALAVDKEERTATGVVKGKASYMAPEQARGAEVSGAADVFALGVTLAVFLGGRSPRLYGAPTEGESPPIPEHLRELVGRCLSDDPAERPTARAVAETAERMFGAVSSESGRRVLKSWLAEHRPQAPKRRALDQFQGRVVVETSPGSRVFEISEARPSHPPTRALGAGSAGPEPEAAASSVARAPSEPPSLPTTPTLRWIGLALLALVGASGGFAAWLGFGPEATDAAIAETTEIASAPDPAPEPDPVAEPDEPDEPGEPGEPDEPVVDPDVASAAPSPAPASPLRGRRARRSEPTSTDGRSPPPLPPRATGYVAVGGSSTVGLAVAIDGSRVGYAPGLFEAGSGRRQLTLLSRAGGEVLHRQTITVDATHTRIAPLRVFPSLERDPG